MIRRWTTILGLAATLPWLRCACQTTDNMIYNPSFEAYTRCPERIEAKGIMNGVEAWWQPTQGSSDYFNQCSPRECGVPRNKMGQQAAHSGSAYCGIYCSQENYREYLQSELKQPLVKGQRYRVSFWVSLAEKSPHAVATIGALLTTERIEDTTSWGILLERETITFDNSEAQSIAYKFNPQVVNHPDSVISDTRQWYNICGEFVAKGGERFITIGNFNSFNHSNVVETSSATAVLQGAYYYIDDVSLVPVGHDTGTAIINKPAATPAKGEVVRLDGIYFATGQSEVLPQSYKELQRLRQMLESNPTMTIELRGHTDNQGTAEFNRQLSEARAQAVADYLIDHCGIDRKRISHTGYGKTMPVDTNETPEGRSHNRRVEFLVVDK